MEKDFIDQLKTIPLTKRQYAALSLPREDIRKRIAGYHVRKKTWSQNILTSDPLVRLVSEYDLSNLHIGFLTFDRLVSQDDDYFQVGTYLESFLCVSRHDGTIRIMRDIYLPKSADNPEYFCAHDSHSFLEALITVGTFLEKGYYDDRLYINTELIDAMSLYCQDVVGKDGTDFFEELLWFHYNRQDAH